LEAALHEARQSAVRQELERKQAQLQALQQEIAALQRRLEPTETIALQFTLLDVNRDVLREADADLAQQLAMWLAASDGVIVQPDPVTKPLAVKDLLQRLQQATETGAVNVRSAPTIITRNGQPARMTSGGSIPLPMPTDANAGAVGYEEFGTRVTVVPKLLDANRVQCTAQYEESNLDWRYAKLISGTNVPGKTVSFAATKFTAEFGETVLFPCPSPNSMVRLLFATVERGETTQPVPAPKAEPTP
jgi:Flp pilus assembly secretin CpaC